MGVSKIFTSVIFSLCFMTARSQVVNIDRGNVSDSSKKTWSIYTELTFSSDKQKKSISDLNSDVEINRNFKNNFVLMSIFRNDALFNGSNTIQNQGLYHLRFRDRDTRKICPEEFLQYQWNGAWGMMYRYLFGANLRFRLIEKKVTDLYIGSGFFYETEKWNWSGVKPELVPPNPKDMMKQMWRSNNYIKYSRKITDHIDITSISYLQFPLDGIFFRPRWYQESKLYFNAGKHINILLKYNHTFDPRRVVPIDKFYYSYSTGIQLKI